MCGIAGYYSQTNIRTSEGLRLIDAISHRGPDDIGFSLISRGQDQFSNYSGAWSAMDIKALYPTLEATEALEHDICLAHNRYSIVDLSSAGHQPMWDVEHRAAIIFNGEIYDHGMLRKGLQPGRYEYRSTCDTETILAAYLELGTEAFARLNGPFAIAIYDRHRKRLVLARDRLGKAPLYYTIHSGRFLWSSEIKSLLAVCGVASFRIREEAVNDFIVHGLRSADGTFWDGIYDFPPGCYAIVKSDLSLQVERYWDFPKARLTTRELTSHDAVETFRALFEDAVLSRMEADIPLGIELSGGLDSSSIVALLAGKLNRNINTYTVAFPEQHANEEPFARAVKDRYSRRIAYNVLRPPREAFWAEASKFVWLQDEPFHLPNLFTNFELRRIIKAQGMGVVLTGAGGDELLAGYGEYIALFIKHLICSGDFRQAFNEVRFSTEAASMPQVVRNVLRSFVPRKARRLLRDHVLCRAPELRGAYRQPTAILEHPSPAESFNQRMLDNFTWAKMNYWLRSGDKLNYGIPIEPRAPFLDHRLIEFCFQLPPEYLIRGGWLKWILRAAMENWLPKEVVWRRKKMGFPFPIQEWLQTSKPIVLANLRSEECPYINFAKLQTSYDDLSVETPEMLWRLISVGLWWRRVVKDEGILESAENGFTKSRDDLTVRSSQRSVIETHASSCDLQLS